MKNRLKTTLIAILAFCLLFSFALPAFAENETVLYGEGSSFEIAVENPKDETLSQAAETLRGYLSECCGKTFKVVPAEKGGSAEVALRYSDSIKAANKGAYRLHFENGAFCIEGADARGVWNGVYDFLDRFYGVRIYSSDVKSVPKAENVSVPADFDYTYEPVLEYADTDWISPHNTEFALANGLNGTYSPLEGVHGGKVAYLWFCHSLSNSIVPASELFDTHPEYFALNEEGERKPTQLCLSNPEVVARAKEDVLNKIRADYNPDAALNIVSVTQDDNQEYCLCDNCTAIAEQYGGQSGLMLWFVNQIAEVVEPEFPDVVVDTFAYQYTRQAPKGIKPRENVCVRLCSIECCFAHALNDPDCESNVKFMKDLEDWSAISNRLYVWDYVTNFLQTLSIFPNFEVIRENTKVFKTHHVVGIYEEGNYYADRCNTEFADLRAYLHARNMRDDLTAEEELALRNDFLSCYYGEGGDEIGQFIDFINEHAGNDEGHVAIYYKIQDSFHDITNQDAKRMNALWDTALQQVKDAGDTAAAERIERSRIGWRFYESSVNLGEYSLPFKLPNVAENKKLVKDLEKTGTTRYNEGLNLDQIRILTFISPSDWGDYNAETNNDIYTPAILIAMLLAAFALVCAVVAAVKKHFAAALLLVVCTVVALIGGNWASALFISWDNLLLYSIADALLLLSVFGFCMLAAWARGGCKLPRGGRLVGTVLVSLFLAAAPYELVILFVNTLKYHGQKPLYSITVSAFVLMGIMCVSLVVFFAAMLKKNQKQNDSQKDSEKE